MISSVGLTKNLIKMKNRIIEILNNNITESKNDYNKIYEKDFDNLANELLEAINYTRCCEELKELDDDNFDDWLIVNGYTVYKDHYMKGDQVFFESELIQKYNNEVMNL